MNNEKIVIFNMHQDIYGILIGIFMQRTKNKKIKMKTKTLQHH